MQALRREIVKQAEGDATVLAVILRQRVLKDGEVWACERLLSHAIEVVTDALR